MLYRTDGQDRIEGVVYKVNEEEIVVSFKEMHDFVSLNIKDLIVGKLKITN